ncbi:phosphotransferase-like protein [Deinococcus ficus]|uniref:phosphotransferase-like protein n=1 Tax=Deinococcus ficus TaxID=317577 RepID=UPI0023EBD80D|nr:AAA family ATPase [Deinococcus ficus]
MINGASSAGKTTLTHALRDTLPIPFLHFSLDFFHFGDAVLPRTPDGTLRDWARVRPQLFEGFHRCLPVLLDAGNNLVVDDIIETPQMWTQFQTLLRGHDVFLVGLHCPLAELERREQARGDRRVGDAARDLLTVHAFTPSHRELGCSASPEQNDAWVSQAWRRQSAAER